MKVLLDTSVLVAALVQSHDRHADAALWLKRFLRGELDLVLAAHSLAELYSVLTSLPVQPRISPQAALKTLDENRLLPPSGKAHIVALSGEDYATVLSSCKDASLAGGIIYDALIFRAAEIAQAEQVITLNSRHFRRLGQPDRVREP